MKYLIYLFLLASCGADKKNHVEIWKSTKGDTLTFFGDIMYYSRPMPACDIQGDWEEMPGDNTDILWHLDRTCSIDVPKDELCYLSQGYEHLVLSCQGLGIHTAFYRQ